MAVAKYWYEKYGAVVAHISNDMIQYYLPEPVKGDTMPLAEEHMVKKHPSEKPSYHGMIRSYQGTIRSYHGMIRLFQGTRQTIISRY